MIGNVTYGRGLTRRLLLVVPAQSYRASAYLDAAADLDCEVTVVTDADVALPHSAVTVSFVDPRTAAARVVHQLGSSVDTPGFDGVIGTDGAALPVAAVLAELLGLRGPSPGAVAAAENKLAQRQALAAAGLPQPRFALAGGEPWTWYPAVVKPIDRRGGQGVVAVDDPGELASGLARVRSVVPDGPILVEELVSGTEVAIEGLLVDGELEVLAVFDKPDETVGDTFPETLLVQPARLGTDDLRLTVELVAAAAAAVGLDEGPIHAECIVGDAEVWFIEMAPRTIGGLCSRTLRPGGVALEALAVRRSLGMDLPSLEQDGPSGVLMLPVPVSGVLEGISGVEPALAVPGVVDVAVTVGVGERVEALPEGDRYLGFVFAEAHTPDEVEVALRQAWSALDVRIVQRFLVE